MIIPCEVIAMTREPYWQFPNWPFVMFDATDEAWCRPLKLGRVAYRYVESRIPCRLERTDIERTDSGQFVERMTLIAMRQIDRH